MHSVSIIVPVYKVEPFLCRCVDSLLAQTFTDFELILVDDGSPDNCGAICDEYAKSDSRIRVVHKENGGLASARNAGLDIACGKYVLFCDSDDYVSNSWCERLVASAEAHPRELVFSNFSIVNSHSSAQIETAGGKYQGLYSRTDFFKKDLPGYAWDKIYELRVLKNNNIYFPTDVVVEDLPFVLEYLKYVDGLYCCGYADYFYYHDERETLSRKYYSDGFTKWKEKYAVTQRAALEITSEKDGECIKRIIAQKYLYSFLHSLDNTFDKRNKMSFVDKIRYNQGIVESPEFQECLALADVSGEDDRYIWLLRKKTYVFAFLLSYLARTKRNIRRKMT